MRGLYVLTALLLAAATVATADPTPTAGELFGAELTLAEATPLTDVIAQPEQFSQKPILIRGKLVDVCQRKGCWTILRDGEAQVRVRFKDYGFFVPKNSRGAEAIVQGVATVSLLSENDARHYESERSGGDASKIHGPRREIGFEATGVRILAN